MATFEEQLKDLETVVERLERGELPLEESLSLFEQGVTLSESCRKQLDAAEGRMQILLQRASGRELLAEDLALEDEDEDEDEAEGEGADE